MADETWLYNTSKQKSNRSNITSKACCHHVNLLFSNRTRQLLMFLPSDIALGQQNIRTLIDKDYCITVNDIIIIVPFCQCRHAEAERIVR